MFFFLSRKLTKTKSITRSCDLCRVSVLLCSSRLALRHPSLLRGRFPVVLYRVARDGPHVLPLACRPPRAQATPATTPRHATTDVIHNAGSVTSSNNARGGAAVVFRLC